MSENKKNASTGGMIIAGCAAIGVGLGMWGGQVPVGSLLGVGIGLLITVLIRIQESK